jgi:hypothetical protein
VESSVKQVRWLLGLLDVVVVGGSARAGRGSGGGHGGGCGGKRPASLDAPVGVARFPLTGFLLVD